MFLAIDRAGKPLISNGSISDTATFERQVAEGYVE